MNPEIHPIIAIFQQRSVMLDMQGSKATSDDALGMLAAWISQNRDRLTEDDLVVLAEVGGMIYRDGLNRRTA